jgi:hypothetical protein
MLKVNQLVGFAVGGAGRVNAVDYNGSTDYLSRASALAGAPDTGVGIISVWFRVDGGDGTDRPIITFIASGSSPAVRVVLAFDNFLRFSFIDVAKGGFYDFTFTSTVLASSSWNHALCNYNHNATSGSRTAQLYLNGVSGVSVGADSGPAFTADYATSGITASIAREGSAYYNGALAELYFAPGQSLDLSMSANREKFNSGNRPVFLGLDGSLPTGTAPAIYLPNPAATVNVNAGTGGNFTINGSPTVASTSPSD